MKKIPSQVSAYMALIGRKGGAKSKRQLSSEQASLMVKLREARRAFKNHHARCFWSYDPDYKITVDDVNWVAEQLMKNGDRSLWQMGKKLCH